LLYYRGLSSCRSRVRRLGNQNLLLGML
jgi:hypothetical protein